MAKKIIISVLLLLLAGCVETAPPAEDRGTEKLTVAATFYPLAEFAARAGGDQIEVIQIIPDGAEPHEYEPSPRDIALIYSADIFLVNGAGLDVWAERIREELEGKGVKVIVMAEHIDLLKSGGDGHADEENEAHGGNGTDPHFWLDPLNAVKEVEIIRDALIEKDPANADLYKKNTDAYIKLLREIDSQYEIKLSSCDQNEIITSHAAFGYLADRYGFTQTGISGISPQEEPSTAKIAALADLAKSKNIKYIFFETLVSPRLAETLAAEVGAQTLLLHPIGGLNAEDIASGKNYATLMLDNLTNLSIALECR